MVERTLGLGTEDVLELVRDGARCHRPGVSIGLVCSLHLSAWTSEGRLVLSLA
jgi:hypothetical protein